MEPIQGANNPNDQNQHQTSKTTKLLLLLINCILVSIGAVAGPLLMRLYFLHGGKRRWLSSWLITAGFPILIFPIAISFLKSRTTANPTKPLVTPRLVVSSALLGFLLGLASYIHSFGTSYLPVSVSSLLRTTQLGFTAIFAYLIAKHKFSPYSINAVVLMMFGSVILGLHMNGNRPNGVSENKYVLGFFMTITGAALHGVIMPLVEFTHLKAGTPITTDLLMQIELLIMMFATLFCTVPMLINKDFQVTWRTIIPPVLYLS